jgi:hypothetical protein
VRELTDEMAKREFEDAQFAPALNDARKETL